MTIQHKDITDPDIHEPKGVSTASIGANYFADGAGSGNWVRYQGWGQYQDSRTTVGTPSQTLTAGARTKFINDGSTKIEKLPEDATTALWDTVNYKHLPVDDFDLYYLRLSFTAENYADSTPYILVELDIGGSIGVIYAESKTLRFGGSAQYMSLSFPVYTGTTYTANGGEFYLTYQGTGTCDIYGSSVLIVRESKNFV